MELSLRRVTLTVAVVSSLMLAVLVYTFPRVESAESKEFAKQPSPIGKKFERTKTVKTETAVFAAG